MQEPIRFILLYIVMPGWLAAGLADWACHKRSDIAHTSGIKESVLHLLMIGQVGAGVLAALFLQINSAVLLLLLALLLGHALTSHWDLHYTAGRRHVSATEQSVHAYLEAFPLAGYALLTAGYWPQFAAIFGAGDAAPDWRWALKEDPLPMRQTAALLLAALCVGFAPFAEEFYRSIRASGRPPEKAPTRD